MKKLIIILLLFISISYTGVKGATISYLPDGTAPYSVTALTPRYLYQKNSTNTFNSIQLEVTSITGEEYAESLSVKLYTEDGEFIKYLIVDHPYTVTISPRTLTLYLDNVLLEDGELVFYEVIRNNSSVLMRGAIMKEPTVPTTATNGVYAQFNEQIYNTTEAENRYYREQHQRDIIIIHYNFYDESLTAQELDITLRLFDYFSAIPILDLKRAYVFDVQGHSADSTNFNVIGDKGFIVISNEENHLLYNPLSPYGYSGASGAYPDLNGLGNLEGTQLTTLLYYYTSPANLLYESISTRFYSNDPFILEVSSPVVLEGTITINALHSDDYDRTFIQTTYLKDNSMALAFDSSMYDKDIIHKYEISDTLQNGDTVGVLWTLTNIYGHNTLIYDSYTVTGSEGFLSNAFHFLEINGYMDTGGKIFVSFMMLILVNLTITLFARYTFIYAISNGAVVAFLVYLDFIPEFMMLVLVLFIGIMFIRALMKGDESYE